MQAQLYPAVFCGANGKYARDKDSRKVAMADDDNVGVLGRLAALLLAADIAELGRLSAPILGRAVDGADLLNDAVDTGLHLLG